MLLVLPNLSTALAALGRKLVEDEAVETVPGTAILPAKMSSATSAKCKTPHISRKPSVLCGFLAGTRTAGGGGEAAYSETDAVRIRKAVTVCARHTHRVVAVRNAAATCGTVQRTLLAGTLGKALIDATLALMCIFLKATDER
ncbi:MAG: hypothetical protein JSW10_10470 [Pseudomonadota bacterium]|nr:MAG: hypothetical protein JSW10_10470 [Pseudomonadota bacterium]